jgi:hypothetical protein
VRESSLSQSQLEQPELKVMDHLLRKTEGQLEHQKAQSLLESVDFEKGSKARGYQSLAKDDKQVDHDRDAKVESSQEGNSGSAGRDGDLEDQGEDGPLGAISM